MNEEKENVTKEGITSDNANRSESETTPLIKSASYAAERLREENNRREKLLEREEQIIARRTLGGETEGLGQEIKPKEETPKEFKDKFLKGEVKFPY